MRCLGFRKPNYNDGQHAFLKIREERNQARFGKFGVTEVSVESIVLVYHSFENFVARLLREIGKTHTF